MSKGFKDVSRAEVRKMRDNEFYRRMIEEFGAKQSFRMICEACIPYLILMVFLGLILFVIQFFRG